MHKRYLSHSEIAAAVADLADRLMDHEYSLADGGLRIYGVPRGGVPVAYLLRAYLECTLVEMPELADVIVDDVIDSGATSTRYREKFPGKRFEALFRSLPGDPWLVFPWEEGEKAGDTSADDIVTRLLQFIGEDPAREGLRETPRRFLKAWQHWARGYRESPGDILKTFEDGAERVDEMVIVRDIPFYSQCEHHLAPFFGTAHIGYIPNGRIVGLSKLSRLLDLFARRLQVQERLTNQVADALVEHLDPLGVGVIVRARHLCMESRGICQQGHSTVTSAMRGALLANPEARAEFIELTRGE